MRVRLCETLPKTNRYDFMRLDISLFEAKARILNSYYPNFEGLLTALFFHAQVAVQRGLFNIQCFQDGFNRGIARMQLLCDDYF